MLHLRDKYTTITGKNRHMGHFMAVFVGISVRLSLEMFSPGFCCCIDGTRTRLSKIRARGLMCHDVGVLLFGMYLMAFIKKH